MQDHLRFQHRSTNPAALAAAVIASVGVGVWSLSGLHSDNRVLDAIPATASLARDIAVGLLVLVWLPLLAIAVVVGVAVLIVAIGRANVRRPALPVVAVPSPLYRTVVR